MLAVRDQHAGMAEIAAVHAQLEAAGDLQRFDQRVGHWDRFGHEGRGRLDATVVLAWVCAAVIVILARILIIAGVGCVERSV